MERYAHVRFRVEDTSPRVLCKLADYPDWMCESDGRFHTTSADFIQPIVEPLKVSSRKLFAAEQAEESLRVNWQDLEKMDAAVAEEIKKMALSYGYDLDPSKNPQNSASREFAAGIVHSGRGTAL